MNFFFNPFTILTPVRFCCLLTFVLFIGFDFIFACTPRATKRPLGHRSKVCLYRIQHSQGQPQHPASPHCRFNYTQQPQLRDSRPHVLTGLSVGASGRRRRNRLGVLGNARPGLQRRGKQITSSSLGQSAPGSSLKVAWFDLAVHVTSVLDLSRDHVYPAPQGALALRAHHSA